MQHTVEYNTILREYRVEQKETVTVTEQVETATQQSYFRWSKTRVSYIALHRCTCVGSYSRKLST